MRRMVTLLELRSKPQPQKEMKTLVATVAIATFLTVESRADLIFCAPGMSIHEPYTGSSINETVNLDEHWRYVVTGIEWRLSAGIPEGGKLDGADLGTRNNRDFIGQSSLSINSSAGSLLSGASLVADSIDDYNSGEVEFSTPIVFENEDVKFTLIQSSNMLGDHGSYVVIKGYSVALPPEPIGTIDAEKVVAVGSEYCTINWTIKRSGVRSYAPSLPDQEGYTVVDATRSNRGHGNNADGVDADNPGNAAQVWRDRGHTISDDNFSGEDNDEGGGSGAAPSN